MRAVQLLLLLSPVFLHVANAGVRPLFFAPLDLCFPPESSSACALPLHLPYALSYSYPPAALADCDITLCTLPEFSGYCRTWNTTLNASPRGDYRSVTDLGPLLRGNVKSFRVLCDPDPISQKFTILRNIFVRMFTDIDIAKANNAQDFTKYYYQTGGWPRFVYRNVHPDVMAELEAPEKYFTFVLYYDTYGSFQPGDLKDSTNLIDVKSDLNPKKVISAVGSGNGQAGGGNGPIIVANDFGFGQKIYEAKVAVVDGAADNEVAVVDGTVDNEVAVVDGTAEKEVAVEEVKVGDKVTAEVIDTVKGKDADLEWLPFADGF
eukprot:gene30902-35955_t